MAAVAVQLTTTLTMAHDLILLSKTLTCDRLLVSDACRWPGFPGAYPEDSSPREASTSLISVRDFLPG